MTEPGTAGPLGLGISVRLRALMAVGLLMPLGLVGWLLGWGLSLLEQREARSRERIALHAARNTNAVVGREMAALHGLAQAPVLHEPVLDEDGVTRELRQRFAHRPELLDALFVLEPPGRVVGLQPARFPVPDAAAVWALAERSPRALLSGLVGEVAFALVPVLGRDGKLLRVVVGVVDPRAGRVRELVRAHAPEFGSLDLLDAAGVVVASSEPGRVGVATRLGPEVTKKRALSATCRDCLGEGSELYALAPLTLVPWAAVVRQQAAHAHDDLAPRLGQLALGAALIVAVALLFAWGAARSVTRPLSLLAGAADEMTQGRLDAPIPPLPDDEVGALGRAFEAMRKALLESRRHLQGVNAGLEATVRERTAQLQQLNEQLEAQAKDRTQLLRTVMQAQEAERKRIARELHDETCQELAALAVVLASVSPSVDGPARARIDEAATLTRHALDEVRRVMMALRPSVLDDLGLQSAIEWSAEHTLERAGLAVRCEFEGFEGAVRLPRELETALFRAVQESMTNIARHAHAETVLVQCTRRAHEVVVEVEDDGRGFEPRDVAHPGHSGRGLGLMGMRERVELFGGAVSLESAPGQGTRVVLTMPVPEAGKE